jgi:multidrug efflux pump subunit AcrA (membrane-fusion protein)
VPEDAVRTSGGSSWVWTIAGDMVSRRPVETGARDRSRGLIEITSGVDDGMRVITGPGEIRDGARIEIAKSGTRGVDPDTADDPATQDTRKETNDDRSTL